jgi:hypothetical protein
MKGEVMQNEVVVPLVGRDHLKDLDVDCRILLKCILKKYGGMVLAGFI